MACCWLVWWGSPWKGLGVRLPNPKMARTRLPNKAMTTNTMSKIKMSINPTILANYAQIGEYVNYDPTTGGNVNSSNTTYTSVPGSTENHGNGYTALADGQTFSAEAYKNSGGKWRIFDIADGKITLISDPIYRDNTDGTAMLSASSTNGLYLNNGIGYLWAEEELHRIAAVYGHGAGADLSQTVTYYYGGPNDQDGSITADTVEAQQGRKATLNLDTPSGARALSLNEIHRVYGRNYDANSSLRTDAKTANNAKYYPTLYTPNTESGKSELDDSPSGNYYYTYFTYSISSSSSSDSIDKANQKSMLRLGKNYWLASRAVCTASATNVMFLTTCINTSNTLAGDPMCSTINFPSGTCNNSVRVLVTLAAGTQTDSKEYNSATGWNIN